MSDVDADGDAVVAPAAAAAAAAAPGGAVGGKGGRKRKASAGSGADSAALGEFRAFWVAQRLNRSHDEVVRVRVVFAYTPSAAAAAEPQMHQLLWVPPPAPPPPPPPPAPAPAPAPKAPAPPMTAAAVKPRCRYWASCYRKNPDHLRDFWHPKDAAEMKRLDDAAAAAARAPPPPAAAPPPPPPPPPPRPPSPPPRVPGIGMAHTRYYFFASARYTEDGHSNGSGLYSIELTQLSGCHTDEQAAAYGTIVLQRWSGAAASAKLAPDDEAVLTRAALRYLFDPDSEQSANFGGGKGAAKGKGKGSDADDDDSGSGSGSDADMGDAKAKAKAKAKSKAKAVSANGIARVTKRYDAGEALYEKPRPPTHPLYDPVEPVLTPHDWHHMRVVVPPTKPAHASAAAALAVARNTSRRGADADAESDDAGSDGDSKANGSAAKRLKGANGAPAPAAAAGAGTGVGGAAADGWWRGTCPCAVDCGSCVRAAPHYDVERYSGVPTGKALAKEQELEPRRLPYKSPGIERWECACVCTCELASVCTAQADVLSNCSGDTENEYGWHLTNALCDWLQLHVTDAVSRHYASRFAHRLKHFGDADPVTGQDDGEWASAVNFLCTREYGQFFRAARHTADSVRGATLLAHKDALTTAVADTTHLLLPLVCVCVDFAYPTPLTRTELDARRLQWWTAHLPVILSRPSDLTA